MRLKTWHATSLEKFKINEKNKLKKMQEKWYSSTCIKGWVMVVEW